LSGIKSKDNFVHLISMKNRLRYLTIAIVLWFLLFPFLEELDFRQIILNFFTSAIVLFGIFAVSNKKKFLAISLIFGLPWFIIVWIDILISPLPQLALLIATIFLILFLAYTAIMILLFLLRSTEVHGDILYGAVSIYFIIGGTFSTIYMLLEGCFPGSIVSNLSNALNISDFIYFSYITLTTLGYGEIIPVSALARSFAIIEAIIGVMYLAIIISRLVGLYISSSINERMQTMTLRTGLDE